MKVPLLDLKAQYATIKDEVREALDGVLESQGFILGPEVESFEKEISKFCGSTYAIGVSSGTDALLLALMALGVGPDDEVIVPAYSFLATAGVVARLGARPVFVDIDPRTFNIMSNAIESKVTARTKAIIPVHLFGRCADMDPILAISESKGIPIIEDAAQAMGAKDSKGRIAGSMGLAGCFSFFPTKNLGSMGDAGLVICNDFGMEGRIRKLRTHGFEQAGERLVMGGNFRLDAIQAAILRVKLKHLSEWNQERRENAQKYRALILEKSLSDQVQVPGDEPGHVYHQFVIRTQKRNGLRKYLNKNGIQANIYYSVPLPAEKAFVSFVGENEDFPHARVAANESLALPIYSELTEDQINYVVENISLYFRS